MRMRQFRLHELPWPVGVLEGLGAAEVRMRITLSYYIEPSASRRGWRQRYRYASHALRFDLQAPLETSAEFVSSRMMSLQSSTHSSQINTVVPAMSFLTSCCDFPQNEQ